MFEDLEERDPQGRDAGDALIWRRTRRTRRRTRDKRITRRKRRKKGKEEEEKKQASFKRAIHSLTLRRLMVMINYWRSNIRQRQM